MDPQVLRLVDSVAGYCFAVGLFKLVEPQMLVEVSFFIAGLNVGDQQEAGKGNGVDGKPSGLHHDESLTWKINVFLAK